MSAAGRSNEAPRTGLVREPDDGLGKRGRLSLSKSAGRTNGGREKKSDRKSLIADEQFRYPRSHNRR